MPPTFADQKEPPPPHIPSFLPAFPDPHTYQHTAAFPGHEADPYKQRQVTLIICDMTLPPPVLQQQFDELTGAAADS
jgi:hypothetical protein